MRKMQTIIILEFSSSKVYMHHINAVELDRSFDNNIDDYINELFDDYGISMSNSNYMIVEGNIELQII